MSGRGAPTTGRYVAFEGIEGAGKSTVVRHLANRLAAHDVDPVVVREPGGTPAGERIREILLDRGGDVGPWTEALLFAAARAQLADAVIGPALAAGRLVLGDRSVYSSLAYQGGGRRLGIDAVRAVNEPGLGPVWPGRVVLLRVEPPEGLRRERVRDRIGAAGLAFLERVADAFDTLASAEPHRFVVLDAGRPLEAVIDDAVAAVLEAPS